jgi:hypothetical protein
MDNRQVFAMLAMGSSGMILFPGPKYMIGTSSQQTTPRIRIHPVVVVQNDLRLHCHDELKSGVGWFCSVNHRDRHGQTFIASLSNERAQSSQRDTSDVNVIIGKVYTTKSTQYGPFSCRAEQQPGHCNLAVLKRLFQVQVLGNNAGTTLIYSIEGPFYT